MNDKDFKKKRKDFEIELNTLIKQNKDNIFYVEFAKEYLLNLKKVNTLDDLNNLREKFIKNLNMLDYRMKFFKLRKDFKERLAKELMDNQGDLEIQELKEEYERKIFTANSLEKLNVLIREFEVSLNELQSIKYQKMLDSEKEIFLNNLVSVENSYSDQETIELIDFCRKKILEINFFNDLHELKKVFREKFQKIRSYEKSLLDFKEKLINEFSSYLTGNYKEEFQELVEDYLSMLKERESFSELKELEESFRGEVRLLNKEILKQEEKCEKLKDLNKKACVYRFYQLSLNSSHERIMQVKEILIKLLEILKGANIRDIDNITVFLSNLDFTNLNEVLEKIKFFEFTRSERVKIINQDYFEKLLNQTNSLDSDVETLDSDTNIKNKIRKNILLKFHYYAIKASIDDILLSLNNLEKILDIVNNMKDYELEEKQKIFTNIDFKDMDKTNDFLNSFKDSSNIYINCKNGKLLTVKIEREEAFLMPLDEYGNNIYVISLDELNENYISVREFFKKATFVNGRHVNEKVDKYNTHELLYLHGQEYLYFYKNLMLVYYGNGFGNLTNTLKFITTDEGYEWNLTGELSQNKIINKFSDRNLCEDMVIKQVNDKLDSYIELNRYKRKNLPNYALPSAIEEDDSKKI